MHVENVPINVQVHELVWEIMSELCSLSATIPSSPVLGLLATSFTHHTFMDILQFTEAQQATSVANINS